MVAGVVLLKHKSRFFAIYKFSMLNVSMAGRAFILKLRKNFQRTFFVIQYANCSKREYIQNLPNFEIQGTMQYGNF